MSQARFGKKVAVPALAVLAGVLLGGCAQRDSIVVGAIPDDYRTNHPIVIGEKEQVIEPLGVLVPDDVFAVKPNVVLPSAAIVPL